MILHPGYVQYGPYISLKAGRYTIKVFGNYFAGIDENSVFINCSDPVIGIENMVIDDSRIQYDADVKSDASMVEFCVGNTLGNAIEIQQLEIRDQSENTSALLALEAWWRDRD